MTLPDDDLQFFREVVGPAFPLDPAAERLPRAEPVDPALLRHPVERRLGTPGDEILTAIGGGFRLLVAVRGRLAEAKLEPYLVTLVRDGAIDEYGLVDDDDRPDAWVRREGRTWLIEVKTAKPRLASRPRRAINVETQKTRRGSEAGSRYYRYDQFEILAACLYQVTGEWSYLFARMRDLAPHPSFPDRLYTMQRIPIPLAPDGIWREHLFEVLD